MCINPIVCVIIATLFAALLSMSVCTLIRYMGGRDK